ncbi:uncharacterized protein LOC110462622 isoform X2 [Mizuhopecten yessoensis]|uniref:uncharacterized protein LOC110462622 isoform X2 n=1 Tax=Mizuhopecten yessoensis TaxID=6573 RepID=UPI000B45EA50|nr:uncharacterized protein LOC110462622 isoform X2 [Mizuhopecten yessoensis]
MKTGAKFSVVVQVFLVYQVTTEIIHINFLKYHFYPVHLNDKCVATNNCTSNRPQKGFHCCPRIEVIRLRGDGGCTKHFCSDTCTQCGRGILRGIPSRRCTSRPKYHTMDIDFTDDDTSHMTFEVNMTVPNLFLIMVCDCYEMSTEKTPMFHECLRLNASDPFHEIHSVPNEYGYFNVALNITQHVQDLPQEPVVESSSVQTTTDVKGLYSTTNAIYPFQRYCIQNKDKTRSRTSMSI